uniref:Uncharacterized protein n=1 Tax=Meloidogyne incognita TaxID=6306 RepID=A0A914N4S9_MELIC
MLFLFFNKNLYSKNFYNLISSAIIIWSFICFVYLPLGDCLSFEIGAQSAKALRDRLQKNSKTIPETGILLSRSGTSNTAPLRVLIGIYIESMGNFQATDMSFDVDLYLYMHWRDRSLNHSNEEYILVNDPKVRDRMWLPDLYFANARNSKFHEVTAPNFNLFIDKDGNIAYSIRITLNVACNLDLANYPMDRQTCGIRIISYAYVESQVNVTWFTANSTRYNPEIGLPEFKIEQLTPDYCDEDKFSCLEAIIHLNRQIGYHLVQSFIPTALIVMISWVSFWIDRRAVPARVTLSFTTLLSLSTLGNGLRFGLPQVAYAKAIDFWFGSCMFFVFLSLVEFAAVNSYMREAEKYERLASYTAKKELHLHDDNSRWSPDESCGESSLLIFGGTNEGPNGFGSRIMSFANLLVPSLFLSTNRNTKKVVSLTPTKGFISSNQNMGNGQMKQEIKSPPSNCRLDNLCPSSDKKVNLGLRLSEHMELRSYEDFNIGGDVEEESEEKSLPSTNLLISISPKHNLNNNNITQKQLLNGNNFSPSENRRNIVVPEMQPWPPSPYEKGRAPPPAPRRVRKTNSCAGGGCSTNCGGLEQKSPMATSHFLRQGFHYSRKGLNIDRWSRILFPAVFTLWNIYYWSYYLWYIQMNGPHH